MSALLMMALAFGGAFTAAATVRVGRRWALPARFSALLLGAFVALFAPWLASVIHPEPSPQFLASLSDTVASIAHIVCMCAGAYMAWTSLD